MEVAVACKSKKPATEEIKKGMTYGGKAMKVIHKGPYESSGAAHEFLHAHIAQSAYDYAGSPWEVYVTGPENEPKEDNWITEIYYPVTPKGEMP
jgi:effector-binding domain-containing protein